MTPEQWRHVTAIFHEALAQEPPARGAFLGEACGRDDLVRAEVERLLAAHDAAGTFGERPLAVGTADVLAADQPRNPAPSATADDDPDLDAAGSEPVQDRAARHPFVYVVWCAALLAAAMFATAASRLILERGATPAFGWTEARREAQWVVSSVDPAGPAAGRLQAGDRIVSLGGLPPVGRGGTTFSRRTLATGQSYHLEVDRRGERLELSLPVGVGPNVLANHITFFVACLVWCVIGLFIGWARPENPAARLAFGAAITTGLAFLNAVVMQRIPIFHPMHVVLGYHFFSRFVTGAPTAGIWRWILVGMYAIGFVPFALGLWVQGTLLLHGVGGVTDLFARHGSVIQLRPLIATNVFYLSLVLMVTAVARSYRKVTSEDHRRRVRWVVYGSVVALTPQILLSAYGVLTGRFPGAAWTFANVFPVLIPVTVAYAVVRHQVFDIRVVVRRTVQYLLARRVLQAATAVPVAALVYTLVSHRHLTIAELTGETRAYLYWLAATGLVLRFRRPIELALDRRFFREEHDREQVLLGMLDEVGRVESIAELSRLVSDRLASVLHPRRAHVWYRDPGERALASSSDPGITPPDVPLGAAWLQWLEARGEAAEFPMPADAGLTRAERRWFGDRGITLVVPVTDSQAQLVGALLLGAKQSDEPYSAADRRLLSAIATQAAVVRETLRLRARVHEEVRVRHDVLARLDGRLPDLLKECPACGACFDGPVEHCAEDGTRLTLTLPVPRTLDGRYRLDRLIGRGGMGAVYEAVDLRLGRGVAVKILASRAFGQPSALGRFRREARAAARLNHPNIVAVHDAGLLEGEGAYLVMERVHGVTLRAALDRQPVLPPAAVAAWFDPLLDGLAAAHAAGIVHRDLKPENVIGRQGDAGRLHVTLLDLGLAKLRTPDGRESATLTVDGVVMGTIGYMSPEQLAGRDVDERTDIYAVGVMLREALTGERPARGVPSAASSRTGEPAGSLAGASPAHRALEALLLRALAADPSRRPASAAAFRREVVPLLHASAAATPGA
jgi:eukaryotic-like serine/threonine-protein kinase